MTDDRSAVIAAVLDYFQGWFDGDVGRMDRALHAELAKRSFEQGDDASPGLWTTSKDRMLALTAQGAGAEDAGRGTDLDIEVVDLYGNIACAVVRSAPYREYLHLVKTLEGWKIVNALWHLT